VKIVAYTRVSTEKQVREGFGLDAQKSEIRRWAKANGHKVVAWCSDEGISGSNGIDTREGLYDALATLKAGAGDALVVTSLDRLARQMTQQEGCLAEVWKSGKKVFSLGDGGEVLEDDPEDPMRTAIRQMRGVFAQLERGLIRQRMAKGKREKHSQGGYVGGAPPFGFDSDHQGNLVPNPEMQATITRIRELHEDGASLRGIVAVLEAEGRSTRSGSQWYPASVARVLQRV
jgi:DNA invertase Pin-like site-specific DNA recombinase